MLHADRLQKFQERMSNIVRLELMLEEFRIVELGNEMEMAGNANQKMEIAAIIAERQARIAQVAEVDLPKLRLLETRLWAVMEGTMLLTAITSDEKKWLGDLYARTMKHSKLSVTQEAELRNRLADQAKRDFDAGRFNTLNDARIHYNLSKEN